MTSVAVLIPVLGRPDRAAPVAESVRASDDRATPVFLVSHGDDAERAACLATGEQTFVVPWGPGRGDWAKKINWGLKQVDDEWLLLGADDLRFHPGWFEEALKVWARSCACVVGTNDMGNPRVVAGNHSTHPLVHREYVSWGTADDASILLHEGYRHQFCDDEFVQTANVRGVWAYSRGSYVEHLHPNWGKAKDDETYRLGEAGFAEDKALYERRKWLWLGA